MKDANTAEPVLRCVFTIQERDNANEIVDIDITIPNEKTTDLTFLSKEENESSLYYEVWNVEYDGRRSTVETVNRLFIPDEIDGEQAVSLSAIPFGEPRFSDNLDEMGSSFGFKPTKYEWQEALGMGSEPITIGFSEGFVGSGCMLGKIESHESVDIAIGEGVYSAIIVHLKTGYGDIPALFPKRYIGQIADGRYVFINTELKADFSCGAQSYYGTIAYRSEEFSKSFNSYYHAKTYRPFAMEFMDENPNYLPPLIRRAMETGTYIRNYYGNDYINCWFRSTGNNSYVGQRRAGQALQFVLDTISEDGQIKVRAYDFHTTGELCPDLVIIRELDDRKISPGSKKLLARMADDKDETPLIINIVNSAILPSYLPGDTISPQLVGLAAEFKYFSSEEEYHDYLNSSGISDLILGDYRIPCMKGESALTKKYDFKTQEICISGIVRAPYVNQIVFDEDTYLTTFTYLWIETKLGKLPIVHTLSIPEEEIQKVRDGSLFFGKITLQGDAMMDEYEKGIIIDHYHNIRALRYYLTNNDSNRIHSIMADNVRFRSDSTNITINGKDEVLAYCNDIYQKRSSFDSEIVTAARNDMSEECIRTYNNGLPNQDIFIELDSNGLITEMYAHNAQTTR